MQKQNFWHYQFNNFEVRNCQFIPIRKALFITSIFFQRLSHASDNCVYILRFICQNAQLYSMRKYMIEDIDFIRRLSPFISSMKRHIYTQASSPNFCTIYQKKTTMSDALFFSGTLAFSLALTSLNKFLMIP